VITETISNLQDDKFIHNIDTVIDSLDENDKELFQPDLLITFGGPVTSKKLKSYLRKYNPQQHWHISLSAAHTDTFQSLTNILAVDEKYLFKLLSNQKNKLKDSYGKDLKHISDKANKALLEYSKKATFTDLSVINSIWKNIPKNSDVHLGNSSPIRYANLFETKVTKGIKYFCNRGVSGIDGITSTASGAAYCTGRVTTLITGDLAFFYDSNALWNKYLGGNLKIIVINNSGGGIFRLIDSKNSPLLEKYFEVKHSMKAEGIVKAHNIPYYSAKNESELKQNLTKLYKDHNGKPAVLEVFTPNELNSEVWSGYFKSLKK
jgi:2-succinyl-5-enolpyruvyl-6-hydroxy-3-cyclohexene-1-carboxylate synthase